MKKIFYVFVVIHALTMQSYAQCWQNAYVNFHSMAVKSNGTPWGWGYFLGGQPCNRTNTNQKQLQPCQGCSFYQFS